MRRIPLLPLTAAVATWVATATPIPIQNHSFEELTGDDPVHFDESGKLRLGHYSTWDIPQTDLGFNREVPAPGWDAFASCGIIAPTLGPAPANLFTKLPDGRQVLFAEDGADVSQELSTSFQAGNRYTLKIDVGRPSNGTLISTWNVLLGITGRVVAFDVGGTDIPFGEFRTLEISYTVVPGDPVVGKPIRISLSGSGIPPIYFDNVRLDVEPAAGPTATIAAAVEVSWPSKVNEWYRVERATRLTDPDWTPITGVLAGTGARMWHFDVPDNSVRYYRVAPVVAP